MTQEKTTTFIQHLATCGKCQRTAERFPDLALFDHQLCTAGVPLYRTMLNERDALLSEVAQLTTALQKILDNDDECHCEHDNENCCELNHVFCPRCIAARALAGKESVNEVYS